MSNYLDELRSKLVTPKAIPLVALTLARLYYGYSWVMGGIGKFSWLTDGQLNSKDYIGNLVTNLATDHGDPFNIGRMMSWIADTFFVELLPGLTDILVVIFEFGIGIMIIIGFRLFWTILLAVFLNLQFFAAGSTNNFGYMVINLIIWKWTKYFDAIGIDGYIRVNRNEGLV